MKYIFLFLAFIAFNNVSAEEQEESISKIQSLLEKNEISGARLAFDKEFRNNDLPVLQFLNAKILMKEAEYFYRAGQHKKGNALMKTVDKLWPNHPPVSREGRYAIGSSELDISNINVINEESILSNNSNLNIKLIINIYDDENSLFNTFSFDNRIYSGKKGEVIMFLNQREVVGAATFAIFFSLVLIYICKLLIVKVLSKFSNKDIVID